MEQYNQNNGNIQKLEDEIRKLAIPYVSEEPGPLYWANFRVRVMERVAQNERKTAWLERIPQFLAGHVWGSGIAISAAALLVAGIMIFQPFGGNAPLKNTISSQPVAVVAPAVSTPMAQVAEKSDQQNISQPTHGSHESYVSKTSDLASVAEPLPSSDDDHPVSLEELSTPELQAVLHGLENNE
jgi:hypothetical protein